MHRVPQLVGVNWGGLPPHLEHTRGAGIRRMIDAEDVAARRDAYEENLQIERRKAEMRQSK